MSHNISFTTDIIKKQIHNSKKEINNALVTCNAIKKYY